MSESRHINANSLELRSPRYESTERRLRGQADALKQPCGSEKRQEQRKLREGTL